MRERFRRILETCEPYVVHSPHGGVGEIGSVPGLELDPALCFDPLRAGSASFLHALQRLDEMTFGPVGMPMPRWVFYDCAESPGGIFGFARRADAVPEWVRRALRLEPSYTGPVPLSMYVAIPMLEPGCWHTYTLCSLNEVAPGAGPANMRLLTEALGLQLFGIETVYGATQWRSPKLSVHTRFGPLELMTSWTPAHSDPATLTFRCPITDERIERALGPAPEAPAAERWIDCDAVDELRQVQREIEAGARYRVIGAPVVEGSSTRVPVSLEAAS